MSTPAFRDRDAVEAYLDTPLVPCLVCGKEFRALGSHVHTHGMSAKEYKDLFRIPRKTSLLGQLGREAFSRHGRNRADMLAIRALRKRNGAPKTVSGFAKTRLESPEFKRESGERFRKWNRENTDIVVGRVAAWNAAHPGKTKLTDCAKCGATKTRYILCWDCRLGVRREQRANWKLVGAEYPTYWEFCKATGLIP